MSLAACMLVYGGLVLAIGPAVLRRVTRKGTAPRLELAAWLAAMGSVLASWALTVALLGNEFRHHREKLLANPVAAVNSILADGPEGWAELGLGAGLLLVSGWLAVSAGRLVAALHRARVDTRRHAEAAWLSAGAVPRGPGGSLVVDAEQRGVYCLPGRPHTIVITRGALAALDEEQLAAVLAHERAHLSGRHHLLLAVTGALAKVLPRGRLFTEGAAEVARLAELCADDTAARRHGAHTVIGALLALAAYPATPLAPSPMLGAAGPGVADRVERLLEPPSRARSRMSTGITLGTLLLGPLGVALVVIVGTSVCLAELI
ncbi:MAG: M56 family metallopeptidase [Pseudonocardia sp.]|nr:M56 family metallopeptidase [Pseudonocardia sp.]